MTVTPVTAPADEPRAHPPTATVAMIGGGQLARMTQQAAIALGVEVHVLAAGPEDPAPLAGAIHHPGAADDLRALLDLARHCDVVTFDHERTPVGHLHALEEAGHVVRPGPHAASLAADKTKARTCLAHAGFPVPAFESLRAHDVGGLERFARAHGWPVVLKAPTGGYDGRGVDVIASLDDLAGSTVAARNVTWLVEAAVPIARELAVVIARRPSGWWRAYPVVETVQRDGICRELIMPARISDQQARQAIGIAAAIADGIDATGTLAVELFLTTGGELLVNELATRPHNSGHATIDACTTSQFENHLRGVLDWPLGATDLLAPAAATVNLLGPDHTLDLRRSLPAALDHPGARVHLYRKHPRPGRKLGHLTVLADDPDDALVVARRSADALLAP